MISDESFRSVAKRKLYGKYGVKEYWLIDFQKQTIEVYLLQGQKLQLQSILTEEDEITSSVLPGYRGKSADLFGGTKNRIKPTRT
jgi:Uma2 family endonuclease